MVHARTADGRKLSFGHSGWLWNNAFLLYDRETDSLWTNATGIALSGPLRGRRLPSYRGTVIVKFAAWRAAHPLTLVLEKPLDPNVPVDSDVYAQRNRRVTFGLAIEAGGAARLYPNARLEQEGVIEDEVGGVPVVVARDAASGASVAFERRVDGKTLSFTLDRRPGARAELHERGGLRAWSLVGGVPVPGTGATAPLCPLAATPWETEAWRLAHPLGSLAYRR